MIISWLIISPSSKKIACFQNHATIEHLIIGTPNNYNPVDAKEEMFSTVNTNTENQAELCSLVCLYVWLRSQKAAAPFEGLSGGTQKPFLILSFSKAQDLPILRMIPPIAFYWNYCFLATKHNYSYQVAAVTGCKDGYSALNRCTLPSNQGNFHRHQNARDRILLRMRSLRCLLCSWCFQPSKVDEETSASLWSWWDAKVLGNEWGSWSLKRGSRVHA